MRVGRQEIIIYYPFCKHFSLSRTRWHANGVSFISCETRYESVWSTTRLSSLCARRYATRARKTHRSIKFLDCLYIFFFLRCSVFLLLIFILALVHFLRNDECVSSDIWKFIGVENFSNENRAAHGIALRAASCECVSLCSCALSLFVQKSV